MKNYNILLIATCVVLFLLSFCHNPAGQVSAQMIERRAETNTLSSVGTATSIVSGKVDVDLQMKSLTGTGSCTVTNRGNYLEIYSTDNVGGGESNTMSSVGTATSIVSGKVGVDLQIKSVHGVGSTTVTNRGNYLEIYSTDNVGSGETNTISSVGTATSIVSGKVGVDLQTKSLAGTGGTTITNRGHYLEINSTSVPTFATQAEAEGGTSTANAMNPLLTYQAVTSYSFLKSNIDISPADGYPDKANGLLGTTMSPSDTLTWNMPADKDFKVNMSGTGKLIASSGTNTVNLSGARYLDYVWSGSSTANSDTNLNNEVNIFYGTLTASSNINCIWEVEIVVDQTVQTNFNPSYKIYLDGGSTASLLNASTGANAGGMWYSGWVANFGSTTTQLYKPLSHQISGSTTPIANRILALFDSNEDTSLRLTAQSGTTTAGYYYGVRHVRVWKTQP